MNIPKKFLMTSSLLLSLFISEEIVFADQIKVRFKVDGITCISTASEAAAIPKRQTGVQSSEVSMVESTVTVVFDDAIISMEKLKAIFKKEGFPLLEEPLILK